MAHEIWEHDKMMYAGEIPWHTLGVNVGEDCVNAVTAIETANLGWTVRLEPSFAKLGEHYIPNGGFTVLREDLIDSHPEDSVLGVVGKRYTPLQNTECFGFFDYLVEEGAAIYETAGSLKNGRRVWILARIPGDLVIPNAGKEDVVQKYILLSNSHDGRSSLVAKFTPIRVVCHNTLSAALSDRNATVTIRHTRSAPDQLREAHKVLGFSTKYYEEFGKMAAFLAGRTISKASFEDYTLALIPDNENAKKFNTRTENMRKRMAVSFSEEADRFAPTWFAAYNAYSGFVDHPAEGSKTRVDCRVDSNWFGVGAEKKEQAFALALAGAGWEN